MSKKTEPHAAEFAVLRATLEMHGCKAAFVTIVGTQKPIYRVSVTTRRNPQRLYLSYQRSTKAPREFKTLPSAIQHAFALSGLESIVVER